MRIHTTTNQKKTGVEELIQERRFNRGDCLGDVMPLFWVAMVINQIIKLK
jgi:hypothetical protein